MTASEARKVVAVLQAAFPRDSMPVTTQAVYVKSLMDFTDDEARRAVNISVAVEHRLPPIAKLRELVIEERLGLPDPHEAWRLALAWTTEPTPTRKCLNCMGTGLEVPRGDGTPQDDCHTCRGSGEVPIEERTLDPAIQRAMDHVGGAWAVKTTDRPEVVRAQFMKAYEQFRTAAVREQNLVTLGVLEPAAELHALAQVSLDG